MRAELEAAQQKITDLNRELCSVCHNTGFYLAVNGDDVRCTCGAPIRIASIGGASQ